MQIECFGQMPDGSEVQRIALKGGGLSAWVLTYGAVLQDLRLEGHPTPLVLGFDSFAPYLSHSPYFGATAGRFANRIRDGHLELDGITHQLDRNFLGKHHLHGGAKGIGKRVWQIEEVTENAATLGISLADGEMGYPGNMQVRMHLGLLPDGVLDIQIDATSDAPTLCSLAHHSYFNLGAGATTGGHALKVVAATYLPVDAELIPTGEVRPVAGTSFDFRIPKPIGPASAVEKIDHNYCLSDTREPLRPVASLRCPQSGVNMELSSTEPGLQIYDGAKVDINLPGLTGAPMQAHAGIAMEPQVWPDANHHTGFPQAVLRPGERYEQHTQYKFMKETR